MNDVGILGYGFYLPESRMSAADIAKTALYRDNHNGTTLADWAFYSWAIPMQTSGMTGTNVSMDGGWTAQ